MIKLPEPRKEDACSPRQQPIAGGGDGARANKEIQDREQGVRTPQQAPELIQVWKCQNSFFFLFCSLNGRKRGEG
jgi:hypothetical protein